ncbi:MAG TPA: right-handed parallel beta-helix repeat-containing protein [Candidatus Eisenbacteria bacterium]|nr:right-handed parallel beta-helix repeat-containing protein [Candidatus Eisenbacteria bacterium]
MAALISMAVPAGAARIVLRPDGSGDVPTFQAGVDCVLGRTCDPFPDTLVVEPGDYAEDVFFDMSAPAFYARIVCPAGPAATRIRSIASGGGYNARITIEGLQVDGRVTSDLSGTPLRWVGCRFMGDAFSHSFIGNQLFNDCEFRARLDVSGAGALDRCLFVGARASLQLAVFGLSIRDCVFQDCADTAVVATPGDASHLSFERCTFRSVDRAIVVNPDSIYQRDGLRVVDSRFEDVRYEAISYDSRRDFAQSWLKFVVLRSSFTRCGAGLRVKGNARIDLTMVSDTLQDTEGPAIVAEGQLNWSLDSLVVRRGGGAGIVLREKNDQAPLFRSITHSLIEENLGDGLAIEAGPEADFPRRRIVGNVFARNRGAGVRASDGVTLLENLAASNGGDGFRLTPSRATGDSIRFNTLYGNGGGIRVTGPSAGPEAVVFLENNLAVENAGVGIALEGLLTASVRDNNVWGNHARDFQGVSVASNLSVNPLFCDPAAFDFHLAENSPIKPGGSQGQIGAFGVGCERQVVAVNPSVGARLAIGRVAPNPLVGGREVTVSFTLPSAGAATMEVLDAAGRRLSSRELAAHEAGTQRVQLRMQDLSPGIYWVRVAQAGQAAASKISIVP